MSIEDSDPKVPPRHLPELTNSGPGGSVQIGQDDLKEPRRKRLGDYAALLTKRNTYNLQPGSVLQKLHTPLGNPAPLTNLESAGSEKNYMDSIQGPNSLARRIFDKTSNSGLLDTDTEFQIKKGMSDDVYKTGTEYFKEIDEKLGEAEIPLRVEEALLANNRFNEKNPALLPGESENNSRTKLGGLIIQPTLGTHYPKKFSNNGDAQAAEIISVDKLKNFGLITLLQASGEVSVPEDLSNPETIKGSLLTGVPGLARIGQRIPVTRFDGVKIINDAYPSFKKSIRDLTPKDENPVPSYGNPNNPFAPFDAFGTGASKASAVLMSLTVSNLLRSLAATVNAVQRNQNLADIADVTEVFGTNSNDPYESKKSRMGHYIPETTGNSYILEKGKLKIDLVDTTNEFFDCLEVGIMEFFNFTGDTAGERFINQTASSVRNSGFQNTILREILRSTTDLFLQQLNPIDLKLNSNYDIDKDPSGGNIAFQVIGNAIDFVSQLNNSKLLKFMNILAMIGDSVLKKRATDINTVNISEINIDEINDIMPGTQFTPNLAVLQMKSKLTTGTLAWNANTTPSAHLIPESLLYGASQFDGDLSRYAGLNANSTTSKRLDKEFIKSLEESLETSYVPFYFHDLRTNEIISFHAFLDSVSDSFSVSYTDTEGYGRTGKILTYKNTTRSISMTFFTVATSETGFDEMWVKVNKLITLLYPQWSEGRVLEFGTQRFVQPFSQIPTSSPLIRIRIGDFIKSNYSKFNLARLFGAGSGPNSFVIDTTEAQNSAAAARSANVNIRANQIKQRMNVNHDFNVGERALILSNVMETTQNAGRNSTNTTRRNGPPIDQNRRYIRVPTATENTTSGTARRINQNDNSNVARVPNNETKVLILSKPTETQANYIVSFIGAIDTLNQTGNFYVPPSALIADDVFVSELANRDVDPVNVTTSDPDAIREFFDETQNPVVKAFETTKGKGLAGFITSFNFEIDNNTTWETEKIGGKAPKMLKISINFEPVHDLNPGIDHNGFNSAPLYNVGNIMNNISRHQSSTELEQEKQTIRNLGIVSFRRRNAE